MRIRKDFVGCVYAGWHRLFAGDVVPEGVRVADWLVEDGSGDDAPADESTEIVIDEDAQIGGEDSDKPSRADNKQAWFDYALSKALIEENATIDDYSKADLIELVG